MEKIKFSVVTLSVKNNEDKVEKKKYLVKHTTEKAEDIAIQYEPTSTLGIDMTSVVVQNNADYIEDYTGWEYIYQTKVKVLTSTDSGNDKWVTNNLFIAANNVREVIISVDKYMENSLNDYRIVGITETTILECLKSETINKEI